MRDVVLQMGISIDGKVSGGPERDIGGGQCRAPRRCLAEVDLDFSGGAARDGPDHLRGHVQRLADGNRRICQTHERDP